MHLKFLTFLMGVLIVDIKVHGAAELHVSSVSNPEKNIIWIDLNSPTQQRFDINMGHMLESQTLKSSGRSNIFAQPSDGSPNPELLGKIDIPSSGRHLLILVPKQKNQTELALIPADSKNLPIGGLFFLNLSTHRIRASINDESMELAPSERGLMPTLYNERKVVNFYVEVEAPKAIKPASVAATLLDKATSTTKSKPLPKWKHGHTATLVLYPNRRYIFVVHNNFYADNIKVGLVLDSAAQMHLGPATK